MIKVIVPLALIGALFVLGLLVVLFSRPRPELPKADRRYIEDTGALLARLLNQTDLDQLDVLSPRSKADVQRLLTTYNRRYSK